MAGNGRITGEKVERLRARIGLPTAARARPFNREAHPHTIRHFAHGYGDDNLLYRDPGYTATSPWRGLIAPSLFVNTLGTNVVSRYPTPDLAQLMRGDPLCSVHAFHGRDDWEFLPPIRPGDGAFHVHQLTEVQVKESALARPAVHLSYTHEFVNERGVLATHRSLFIHAERDTPTAGKERSRQLPTYTEADREQLDRELTAWHRRGANTRRFEEIETGEEFGPLVEGPLLVTDIILSHTGRGPGHMGIGALNMAFKQRQRMGGLRLAERVRLVERRSALPLGRRVRPQHRRCDGLRLRHYAHVVV
jgi:acyl dehydratase